jgi:hypothetical protein
MFNLILCFHRTIWRVVQSYLIQVSNVRLFVILPKWAIVVAASEGGVTVSVLLVDLAMFNILYMILQSVTSYEIKIN